MQKADLLTTRPFEGLNQKLAVANNAQEKKTHEPTYIRVKPVYLTKLYQLNPNYEAIGRDLYLSGAAIRDNLKHPDGCIGSMELAAKTVYAEKTKEEARKIVVIATMTREQAKALAEILDQNQISHHSVEA